MPGTPTAHRPLLAIALKIGAIGLFTLLSAVIKSVSDEIPPGQSVFFRSLFAIPVILVWLAMRGEFRHGLVTSNPRGHFWRGVLGTASMGMTFAGLAYLPLPEVTAIGYATPIFTVILAAVMLGETIRLIRISAVAIGLAGVLIMIWPRFGGDGLEDGATIGALLILGATLMRALVQIHVRQLAQTEHTAAIVFYFSATASALSLTTAVFGWVMPSLGTLALLIGSGLVGGLAQIFVTSAYRFGPASMLAPYDYTSMLFAIVIGFVWFAELPTVLMLLGAALVIAGNALVIWRERKLGLERSKSRSLTDTKT